MSKWDLHIRRVANGYILKGYPEGSETIEERLIEEPSGADGELKAMETLLWEVKEYFGIFFSKHAERNLIIRVEDKEGNEI